MSKIVIVGAGRGIGLELVKKSIAEGHHVLVLTRNIEVYEKLEKNDRLYFSYFDLEENDCRRAIFSKVKAVFSEVDIMINNAGFLVNKPFEEVSDIDIRRSYQVNVIGVFQSIQGILPLFSDSSHIVNISSMGGVQGASKFPGLSAYSPAKAALCSITEILAEEFIPRKIKVNCLALGAVQTEMLEQAFPGYKAPLSAVEMAEYILDFSVNGSKYFNGKILPVSVSTP